MFSHLIHWYSEFRGFDSSNVTAKKLSVGQSACA